MSEEKDIVWKITEKQAYKNIATEDRPSFSSLSTRFKGEIEMKSEKEIKDTLKSGEDLLKDAVEGSSHQKYMRGYTNALKFVIGEKQVSCIVSKDK